MPCFRANSGLAEVGTALAFPRRQTALRPNILFILSDDHGLDGVGAYGSERFKGKTPNLDALVQTGIRFTQAYSMPLHGV